MSALNNHICNKPIQVFQALKTVTLAAKENLMVILILDMYKRNYNGDDIDRKKYKSYLFSISNVLRYALD